MKERPETSASRLTGAGIALILHAGVAAVLLQLQPVRSALTNAMPIMVNLVTPPAVIEIPQELPRPLPVKPRLHRTPLTSMPLPLVSAASDAAPPAAAPAQQPEPPAPSAPAIVAPASAPAVIPPSFNADYLDNPPPGYPAVARRMGQQGKVMLRVLVNAAGGADKVEIRASSGYDRLDEAALAAVRRWRFVPASRGGTPVAAWVLVPITFTLEG